MQRDRQNIRKVPSLLLAFINCTAGEGGQGTRRGGRGPLLRPSPSERGGERQRDPRPMLPSGRRPSASPPAPAFGGKKWSTSNAHAHSHTLVCGRGRAGRHKVAHREKGSRLCGGKLVGAGQDWAAKERDGAPTSQPVVPRPCRRRPGRVAPASRWTLRGSRAEGQGEGPQEGKMSSPAAAQINCAEKADQRRRNTASGATGCHRWVGGEVDPPPLGKEEGGASAGAASRTRREP